MSKPAKEVLVDGFPAGATPSDLCADAPRSPFSDRVFAFSFTETCNMPTERESAW